MALITGLLALGSAAAGLISGIAGADAQRMAEEQQRLAADREYQYRLEEFKQREKQKKELERSQRRQAMLKAMRIDAPAVIKQVPGVAPYRPLYSPSLSKQQRSSNVWSGISQGLALGSNLAGSLQDNKGISGLNNRGLKSINPNAAVNYRYDPTRYQNTLYS